MPAAHGFRHFTDQSADTDSLNAKYGKPSRTVAAVDCTWYGGAPIAGASVTALLVAVQLSDGVASMVDMVRVLTSW